MTTETLTQLWESLSELLDVPEIAYSDDWNGCGLVLEAMRERGWGSELHTFTDGQHKASFTSRTSVMTTVASFDRASLPRAVAEAARAALLAEVKA